ncbi:hypothetical protein F070042J6_22900 [Bacteroides sp. f07]|uniref:hypothetical protein n=1 Tax=Bacteroides sp. f07 TaxID=3132704 RepID=UPI0034A828C6
MTKTINNISSFNPQFWRIGELGLYETEHSININSLDGDFVAWFDVGDENSPTEKQLAAWEEFCKINPMNIKEMIIEGLVKLSRQMNLLPADINPQYGPGYNPKVVSRNAKKAIEAMSKNNKSIGKQAKSVFQCNSIVIPKQEKSPVRFIVMNFEIGRRPYEMEAVFCNERMLMVGENSGIWTRLDWIYEFNIPNFKAETALHPYWQQE